MSTGAMRILFVESRPSLGIEIADSLRAAGHDLVGCHDADGLGPCKAAVSGGDCPLDSHVDIAVVARLAQQEPTLDEMGGVCAERHRVPVVRIDPRHIGNAVAAIEASAVVAHTYTASMCGAAVRAALAEVDVEVRATHGVDCWSVVLRPNRDLEDGERWAIADRARAAVRAFDPFAKVIDVAVDGTVGAPA